MSLANGVNNEKDCEKNFDSAFENGGSNFLTSSGGGDFVEHQPGQKMRSESSSSENTAWEIDLSDWGDQNEVQKKKLGELKRWFSTRRIHLYVFRQCCYGC